SAELFVTNASFSVLVPPLALPSRGPHPAVIKARPATDAISLVACRFISASSSQRDRSSAERHDTRRRSRKDVRPVTGLLFIRIRHARDRGRGLAAPNHGDCATTAASR